MEQRLSCLGNVLEVDESDPEEEFDKLETTIGTKFLRVALCPNPNLYEMWYLTISIRNNIRFDCKTFKATILLACFRGLSVKNMSIF